MPEVALVPWVTPEIPEEATEELTLERLNEKVRVLQRPVEDVADEVPVPLVVLLRRRHPRRRHHLIQAGLRRLGPRRVFQRKDQLMVPRPTTQRAVLVVPGDLCVVRGRRAATPAADGEPVLGPIGALEEGRGGRERDVTGHALHGAELAGRVGRS